MRPTINLTKRRQRSIESLNKKISLPIILHHHRKWWNQTSLVSFLVVIVKESKQRAWSDVWQLNLLPHYSELQWMSDSLLPDSQWPTSSLQSEWQSCPLISVPSSTTDITEERFTSEYVGHVKSTTPGHVLSSASWSSRSFCTFSFSWAIPSAGKTMIVTTRGPLMYSRCRKESTSGTNLVSVVSRVLDSTIPVSTWQFVIAFPCKSIHTDTFTTTAAFATTIKAPDWSL